MSNLVVDTHTAIWYFARSQNLSAPARTAINSAVSQGGIIYLPTISSVEIVYLLDKNKLAPPTLPSLMQR
ncbi:MAG TPA: hypothetical protein VFZ34_33065 [Blastocatellia bacterium]|nr:hypothetical protein [Blastocatellia bacterium]